jgi:predicted regulator of Ras-like GTPase activity (Roadblock/LC7/MglB family)
MPDEIARLSEVMAREPGGMAWVALADALRRARRLADAERVALRGLGRHPYHADGHDVLARIAADGGDRTRARDEWEMSLRIEERHVGARLGLSWLALSGGDHRSAIRRWEEARAIAPADPVIEAVGRLLARAPRPTPAAMTATPAPATPATATPATAPPAQGVPASALPAPRAGASHTLFAEVERAGARAVLLVDEEGLVLAGRAPSRDGRDRADELGAELRGLSSDAERALRQLQLGAWEQMQVECDAGTLALGPAPEGAVALVATGEGSPAGLPRLLLDRARRAARAWMAAL